MPNLKPASPAVDDQGAATLYGVGIWHLHVVIMNDDGSWFAQGGEIDYAAQGDSLPDVKKRFEEGLCATIHEHLEMYGNINHLIQAPPAELWAEIVNAATSGGSQAGRPSGAPKCV